MSNQGEIVVSRRNLFLDSEDRNLDVNTDEQYNGQKLSIPLQGLGIVAGDNQFIRLKLESFTAPNSFDNHAAINQRIYSYFGENVVPKQNNGDTPSPVFPHSYLTLPRYTSFADIMLDAVNSVALNFQAAGFTTTDWGYTNMGIWGQGIALGPAVARAGSQPSSGLPANTVSPADEPSSADNYDTIGYYSQGGYNGLAASFTLLQNKTLWWGDAGSGSNVPPTLDNTSASTAFQQTSQQDSDIYLQVGGRKGYVPTANFPSGTIQQQGVIWKADYWQAEATANGTKKQLFNVTVAKSTTGSGTGARTTFTVTVATALKAQLNINKNLFLRTNLTSTNFQTDNFNQRESVQSSTSLSASNILACFPMNTETIYYTNQGSDTWQMDVAQRTIPTLELFLTNKNNCELIRDNPNPVISTPNYNINFQCVIRIEVIERAVIKSGSDVQSTPGELPSRFTSNVPTNQSHGNDFTRNSNFTRLANSRR
tara:strand:+ start:432 stop:1877 length:1446 start_codon:yes stop_codon:yes gene_type:complete